MRIRSFLIVLIAITAAAQPARSGAEGRLTNDNVSVMTPPGWRTLTRAELAANGDPQPLIALVHGNAAFQVVKSKLPQSGWRASQVAGASMAFLLLQFKNGEVETPLHDTTVAGLPASEWTATYSIAQAKDGRVRLIAIVAGDSSYTIAASGPAAEKDVLDGLVKSLAIGR